MKTRFSQSPRTSRSWGWVALALMLGTLALGGCGKKGPLYLPQPPQDGARP